MNKLKFILPLILATITLVTFRPIEAQANDTLIQPNFTNTGFYKWANGLWDSYPLDHLSYTNQSLIPFTSPITITGSNKYFITIFQNGNYLGYYSNITLNAGTKLGDLPTSSFLHPNATHFAIGSHLNVFSTTYTEFQTIQVSYSTPAPAVLDFQQSDSNFSGLITIRTTENITQTVSSGPNRYAHVLEVTHPSNFNIDNLTWLFNIDSENIENSTLIPNQETINLYTITSGTNKVTYIYNTGDDFIFGYNEEDDFYGAVMLLTGSGVFNNITSPFSTLVYVYAPDDRSIRDIESDIERQSKSIQLLAPSGTTWPNGSSAISFAFEEYGNFELPTPPAREGYQFINWEISRYTVDNAFDPQWESEQFTLFTRNDGQVLYHFFDFNDNSPSPYGFTRIAPVYEQLQFYTVTFTDWDNSFISSGIVQQGQSATLPNAPTRIGHTFTGWEPPVANIQGNITTVAQYTPNQYTVTWRDTNFSTLKIETVQYSGLAVAPTIQGFTQLVWSPNPNQPISENTTFVLVSSAPITSLPSPTSLTDLFTAVLGSSVGAILTIGTIDLFGIQLSSLIYLFVFGSLALTFLKIIRGN